MKELNVEEKGVTTPSIKKKNQTLTRKKSEDKKEIIREGAQVWATPGKTLQFIRLDSLTE